jgi:2-polyprenyl-3-methyl-5-hydroxy-6-metoxy-1,4-benzoquinol methylase
MPSIEEGNRLAQIRSEEKEYHDQCYAEHVLFQPGSWLYKPVQTVMELLSELSKPEDVQILDLGCGVGRNTIPMAVYVKEHCTSGQVIGVDLLESAIVGLNVYSAHFGVENVIRAEQSEIEDYFIHENKYDFIVAVSALEHLCSVEILKKKLFEIASGIKSDGIVCLIMSSNIRETLVSTGESLDPKFEINLRTEELLALLDEAFMSWKGITQHVKPLSYHIDRHGQPVLLSSDCLTFTARKKV